MTRTPSTALSGRHALVTGTSSGLGADFARELAGRGADVEVVALDLNQPDAPDRLRHETEGRSRPVDVLVNNAGFGLYGPFSQLDWERERAMLELDMIVPVHLTKLFLPGMLERRPAGS
jgi:uncharacterized protein